MTNIESFNSFGIENINLVPAEKMKAFNANFPTRIAAENGNFGRIDGLSAIIRKQTGWSFDITDSIRSLDESKIYKEAKLIEADVGVKKGLVKNDINWFQTDEFGRTNLQRIENGYAPLDANGQKTELHHIGQRSNSPLAELTIDEHRVKPGNNKVLHPESTGDNPSSGSNWESEREQYWKDRNDAEITKKQVASQRTAIAHQAGKSEGLCAAMITGAISTADNVRDVYNGEITVQEAAVNIAVDVGTAAALGYTTGYVSTYVSASAAQSAHKVINTLGGAGVPAAAVSLAIASYDSVIDFAKGEIGITELVYDLGENTSGVAGAMAGAKAGMAAGAVIAGAPGAVAGGLIGGMIGYMVCAEAYATVIDTANNGLDAITYRTAAAAETAADLKNKAAEMGQGVLDTVSANVPEAYDTVKTALNDFASNLKIPLNFV